MEPTLLQRLSVRNGDSVMVGSLIQDRPWYPSLQERAMLVRNALPPWAIASGTTAGWVWTGMGTPDPWTILRPEQPAISPLDRTSWRARIRNPRHHDITRLNGLTLLERRSCVREILLGGGDIDMSATQIMVLTDEATKTLESRTHDRRASSHARAHADAVLLRLRYLRDTYPDITRYTS